MSGWAESARATIAAVHFRLADDCPLAERIKAVDDAYPFGKRAYWPYKAWLKARKAYLIRYGYRPRGYKDDAPLFPDLPRDPVTGRPVIA